MKKLAITALAICAPLSSFAATLWDNGWDVGQGGYYADSYSNFSNQWYTQVVADNFTLGSDSNVTKVTFWGASEYFIAPDLTNMASFDIVVLDSDFDVVTGGTYGLSDLGINVVGTDFNGANEYEISLDTNWNLAAGNYYLSVGATLYDGGLDAFYWTQSNTDTGLYASLDPSVLSFNAFPDNPGVAFKIEGEPVPEPATMAVLGLGAAALIRRRRQSK